MKTALFPASLALLGAVACGGAEPVARPLARPETATAVASGEVDVAVRAPARAVWAASTLGTPKPTLQVVVTNRGATPLDVSGLRVHLDAVRDETAFHCADSAGPGPAAREPATLAPGGSFAFDREVDCALPLTGRYTVRVSVSFGDGAWRRRRPVQSSTLVVTPSSDDAPRAIASVPGLWAALGASRSINGETRAGHGRIAILLVNGGAEPITPPPLRLALRVYRAGTSIPCEDEPIAIAAPPRLAPGQSYRQSLEVSCLGLHATGRYDVVGRLVGAGDEVEIGRLRVEIADDPSLLAPSTPIRWR